MKPDRRNLQHASLDDHAWRKISASGQASYRLNIMLAEMEYDALNPEKAAIYYMKALKTYFRTDVYKLTLQCIRKLPVSKQNMFLYKLGKCLLVHCHQSELAQETLDKLSILDPSFLRPVQKIFMVYEDENSADRRQLNVILEESSRKRKVLKSKQPVTEAGQRPVKALEPESKPESKQDLETEVETEAESATEAELMISFEETGEHFTVQKESSDSVIIDKGTLDGLMDSLLTDDD